MRKSTTFLLLVLHITFLSFSQNDTGDKSPTSRFQHDSLKKTQQPRKIEVTIERLKAAKKKKYTAKKEKVIAQKKQLKLKKQLLKINALEIKRAKKDKKLLEKSELIALKKATKRITFRNKNETTLALKEKLKQQKQLLKINAFKDKKAKRDKRLLEKAEIIAIKESTKSMTFSTKNETTLALKKQLKRQKEITKKQFVADKKNKRAIIQLEILQALTLNEIIKKNTARKKKQITNTLQLQLKQKKLLIKERAIAERKTKRAIIQADVLQAIASKEANKKDVIKGKRNKVFRFKGEVKKVPSLNP